METLLDLASDRVGNLFNTDSTFDPLEVTPKEAFYQNSAHCGRVTFFNKAALDFFRQLVLEQTKWDIRAWEKDEPTEYTIQMFLTSRFKNWTVEKFLKFFLPYHKNIDPTDITVEEERQAPNNADKRKVIMRVTEDVKRYIEARGEKDDNNFYYLIGFFGRVRFALDNNRKVAGGAKTSDELPAKTPMETSGSGAEDRSQMPRNQMPNIEAAKGAEMNTQLNFDSKFKNPNLIPLTATPTRPNNNNTNFNLLSLSGTSNSLSNTHTNNNNNTTNDTNKTKHTQITNTKNKDDKDKDKDKDKNKRRDDHNYNLVTQTKTSHKSTQK